MSSSTVIGVFVTLCGLGACQGTEGPPTILVEADSADAVIFGLDHNVTIQGVLQARIQADTAFLYEGAQSYELRQLTVTFYTAMGEESSTLTSLEGTYETRTGNMEARINVVGLTPDGRRLTTSTMMFDRLANQLVGNEAFVFDAPDRHLEGNSFTADPHFTDVQATGISGRTNNR